MVALLPRLRRFAYVLTRDMELADDLVQDTCLRALDKIGQWEEGTRLDSWLFRIAQNIWFDRLRALKSRGPVEEIDAGHEYIGEDGRDVTESRLALSDISKALEKLSPEQQVLIALVCIDGLSYKEAADTLEIPIGTVMSRLARARQSLHTATEGGPKTGQDKTSG
jgi:RNA polymerase sigma-70 factor (ECF subfamily)